MNSDTNENEFLLKRKKKKYNKIEINTKNKLIKLVLKYNWLLKDAAKELKMNYSTAKTIMKKNRDKRQKNKREKENLDEEENSVSSSIDYKTSSVSEAKQLNPSANINVCSETHKCNCKNLEIETSMNTVQMIELSKIVKDCLEATKMNQQLMILTSIISAFRFSFLSNQETTQLLTFLSKTGS